MIKFESNFDNIIQDIKSEIVDTVTDELKIEGVESMFQKLPLNSEKLLDDILDASNPVDMLEKRFESCTSQEDNELRGMIGELEENGYLTVFWGSDVPIFIQIKNSARTYHEQLKYYEKDQMNVVNNYNFNVQNTSALRPIFDTIRQEAEKLENNEELLRQIDSARENIGKPSFFQQYNSLISSAANHETFLVAIAPYLKKITDFLIS